VPKGEIVSNVAAPVLDLGKSEAFFVSLARMIIMELIVDLEFFVASEDSHCQVLFPFIF